MIGYSSPLHNEEMISNNLGKSGNLSLLIGYDKNQILEISHQEGSCHIDKGSDITLPVPVNSSINYQHNTHHQPIKKLYIYKVLMKRESDNMGLVPYNF
jgi:hypothetical protein